MRTWPHAPSKCVISPGTYIVTAGTYHKEPLFKGSKKLEILYNLLLETADEQGWDLLAWAAFANHYHIIGNSPQIRNPVGKFCGKVHMKSAKAINLIDDTPGRMVWYRSWDRLVTYEKSVMARIAYVHHNPVKHGLVARAEDYPWCSAAWFLREGDRPFVESVLSFKIDRVNVEDDF